MINWICRLSSVPLPSVDEINIYRFESISVRDHITNLYAPRLIVEKTMTEQQRQESVVSREGENGMNAVDSKQKDKMERKQFR